MTVRRLLAVVAWTLLVLVCSTGVWGVIRTAGTGVTSSPEVPSTTIGPTTRATTSPGPATASSRPHPQTRPRAQPTPTAPQPSPTPGTRAPTRQPADGTDDRGGTEATKAPRSPEASEVQRTWQGAAGAVVASCRGAIIGFRGAQPNPGWRVEVGDRGPEQIEVSFARNEDEGEVELKARCVGSEPRFSTAGD